MKLPFHIDIIIVGGLRANQLPDEPVFRRYDVQASLIGLTELMFAHDYGVDHNKNKGSKRQILEVG